MKYFYLFLTALTLVTPSYAQTGKQLMKDGNFKEAAEMFEKILVAEPKPATDELVEAMEGAFQARMELDDEVAAETVVEDTLTRYPDEWKLFDKAGQLIQGFSGYGTMVDGAFVRGDMGDGGTYVNVGERDHVRSLQMYERALRLMPETVTNEEKASFYGHYMLALTTDGTWNVWRLQVLTDISQLPKLEVDNGIESPASGWPVDADGSPVWFVVPESWEKAANDGERWRWLNQQCIALGGNFAMEAQFRFVENLADTLGIANVAHQIQPRLPNDKEQNKVDPETEKRGIISAVHTLKPDETVMALATGPKRITLPPDYAFLPMLQNLADGPDVAREIRVRALSVMAEEFENRQQLVEAASAWTKARDLSKGFENEVKSFTERLRRIVEPQADFEMMPTQAAGKKAKISFSFRNGTAIQFTARPIDTELLIQDVHDYILSRPAKPNYARFEVDRVSQVLMKRNGKKYLGEPVHKWTVDLVPAERHRNRHMELDTPMQTAGAWWVEGTMKDGNTIRQVLWLESITLLKVQQTDGTRFTLVDAITGAPVPEAKLSLFGYSHTWNDPRGAAPPKPVYSFRSHEKTTDATGSVFLGSELTAGDMEWHVTARDPVNRRAYFGFQPFYVAHPNQAPERSRVFFVTDQPVYRPDQEVRFKFWARAVSYDSDVNANPYAGRRVTLQILDPKGSKLLEKEVALDEAGAAVDVIKLGANATLGVYHICVATEDSPAFAGVQTFQVEEYKKPEFEVKITAPEAPVKLGDSFEAKISADYYFGGPVKEGKVTYRVMRSAYKKSWIPPMPWDWLFGSGYNWRVKIYDWYEGADRWSRCAIMPPWFPRNVAAPELVAEGQAALAPDGTFVVKLDTAATAEIHGDTDHQYEITAEVTDRSRRTIRAASTVLAARKAFETYVWFRSGWVRPGETTTTQVSVRSLDGKPVDGDVTLKVFSVTYDESGKASEKEVASFDLKAVNGVATEQLTLPAAGQYRVAALVRALGGTTGEGTAFLNVRGEGDNGGSFRYDDIELIVKQEEASLGDEVDVLINTNRPGANVALFVRPKNGTYAPPEWIKMEGKSVTRKIIITEADQPNIFLEALTVSDARVHTATAQVIVPPVKKIATVVLTSDKETYVPREESAVAVSVKDQTGAAFEGQLILTGYDKALEYISGGGNVGDIRKFFWEWTNRHTTSIISSLRESEIAYGEDSERMYPLGIFDRTYLPAGRGGPKAYRMTGRATRGGTLMGGRAAEVGDMALGVQASEGSTDKNGSDVSLSDAGGVGVGVAGVEPMIRSEFADTAVWISDAKLDADGRAALSFPIPDNLTTWKLRAWVIGPDNQVGEAEIEVVSRKNLLVRLQAPRFFTETDEVTLSAIVNNDYDTAQNIRAFLELEGGTLSPVEAAAELTGEIPAHGERRFDWRVKVNREGEAKIRVKAIGQADSDSMEMTFPVFTHGMLKRDSRSLGLRSDDKTKTVTLTVPAHLNPHQTRLEIRYSPTLAMAMVDALPYLNDYPYGSTEQTLNRFVPSVLTHHLLKSFQLDLRAIRDKRINLNAQQLGGSRARTQQQNATTAIDAVFDADIVADMARTGLERLANMQNADGGWAWFHGGESSTAHMTALVLRGLRDASAAGLAVSDEVTQRGVEWLTRYEQRELRALGLPKNDKNSKQAPDNVDALVHTVLVSYQSGDGSMRERLYAHRLQLTRLNQALLGLACHEVKETERRDMLLRNLNQFVKEDAENQTAWLELPGTASWWSWYDDEIETQAAWLRLLTASDPKSDRAAAVAKYLVNNRRHGSYWTSTRDTAAVIAALADFVKQSGEGEPDVKVEILIDGKSVHTAEITKQNLFSNDGAFVWEGAEITPGDHTVEIRKTGSSPLYANAYLTVFTKEDHIKAAGLEVKTRRAYYKLIEEKPEQIVPGQRGQATKQMGFHYRKELLTEGAELKSGDLVEVQITVVSKNDYEYVMIEDRKPAGFESVEVRSGWNGDGLRSYQEFRDEKVVFFAELLPHGSHMLTYRVKAEVPGKFSAMPAIAEGVYAPELRGNSDEWKVHVHDAE